MFNKPCRCCQQSWTSVASFVDDLSLVPAGRLSDPNPAADLAVFIHDCGEVLYIEQRRLDDDLLRRRMQTAGRAKRPGLARVASKLLAA